MNLKTLIAFAFVVTIFTAGPASAQYDLNWVSIDCGGGVSSGGSFSMQATIAQPDAATASPSGGAFVLRAGYLSGVSLCVADVTHNGVADIDDLLAVINGWGPCLTLPCSADVNNSGAVDIDDLLTVINGWGPCL